MAGCLPFSARSSEILFRQLFALHRLILAPGLRHSAESCGAPASLGSWPPHRRSRSRVLRGNVVPRRSRGEGQRTQNVNSLRSHRKQGNEEFLQSEEGSVAGKQMVFDEDARAPLAAGAGEVGGGGPAPP